jgi:predicted transposase YbfD/YdcC
MNDQSTVIKNSRVIQSVDLSCKSLHFVIGIAQKSTSAHDLKTRKTYFLLIFYLISSHLISSHLCYHQLKTTLLYVLSSQVRQTVKKNNKQERIRNQISALSPQNNRIEIESIKLTIQLDTDTKNQTNFKKSIRKQTPNTQIIKSWVNRDAVFVVV